MKLFTIHGKLFSPSPVYKNKTLQSWSERQSVKLKCLFIENNMWMRQTSTSAAASASDQQQQNNVIE